MAAPGGGFSSDVLNRYSNDLNRSNDPHGCVARGGPSVRAGARRMCGGTSFHETTARIIERSLRYTGLPAWHARSTSRMNRNPPEPFRLATVPCSPFPLIVGGKGVGGTGAGARGRSRNAPARTARRNVAVRVRRRWTVHRGGRGAIGSEEERIVTTARQTHRTAAGSPYWLLGNEK
jgi:hypothetical protein